MEIGKIPPNDVEAEQAVLGSMLLDKDAVIEAVEALKPEDFYREENKLIFLSMLSLYKRVEPVDIITVKDELVILRKTRCLWRIRIHSKSIRQSTNNSKCKQIYKNSRRKISTKKLNQNIKRIDRSRV